MKNGREEKCEHFLEFLHLTMDKLANQPDRSNRNQKSILVMNIAKPSDGNFKNMRNQRLGTERVIKEDVENESNSSDNWSN